jgi:hypothetical protein
MLQFIAVLSLFISTFTFAETTTFKSTQLGWEPVPGAASYQVEVARDSKMLSGLTKKLVAANLGTNITLQLKPGNYFFRVRALTKAKEAGPWSEVEGFVINQNPPRPIGPSAGMILKSAKVDFAWERAVTGTQYRIQIVNSQNAIILDATLDSPNFSWQAPAEGTYSWRIGYKITNSAEWSKSQDFQLPASVFKANQTIVQRIVPNQESVSMDAGSDTARTWAGGFLNMDIFRMGVFADPNFTGKPWSGGVWAIAPGLWFRVRPACFKANCRSGILFLDTRVDAFVMSYLDDKLFMPRYAQTLHYGFKIQSKRSTYVGPLLQFGREKRIIAYGDLSYQKYFEFAQNWFGGGGFISWPINPNVIAKGSILAAYVPAGIFDVGLLYRAQFEVMNGLSERWFLTMRGYFDQSYYKNLSQGLRYQIFESGLEFGAGKRL